MREYLRTKEEYKDCILFYRLGDFYEMFFEDAKLVSKELELTLTGKSCGLPERAPMCGVPHHALDTYLNRLVGKGYKVAICEQMEDPKEAKGIVRREVIRVVTPGTNLADENEGDNIFLMTVLADEDGFGVAYADISTGEFRTTVVSEKQGVFDEITKLSPREILLSSETVFSSEDKDAILRDNEVMISPLAEHYFDMNSAKNTLLSHFHAASEASLGLGDHQICVRASGALLKYLYETQKNELPQIKNIRMYEQGSSMLIDSFTRRNLELFLSLRDKKKTGSLFWVLDKTKTAMGARMLKSYIEHPLLKRDEILRRQDGIGELIGRLMDREELGEYLSGIYDLERLLTRISLKTANPRDLIAFKRSISYVEPIKNILSELEADIFKEACREMDTLKDIYELIENAIEEEPPILLKEGGIIKESYSEDVKRLRDMKQNGAQWINELEESERERTGIKNLKVGYNKVFGYYIEITNSFKDMAPDDYIRKQTLVGSERYITPRLKEIEDAVLSAAERVGNLEYELFCDVRDRISAEAGRVQKTAYLIAVTDAIVSLAKVAAENDYTRPDINEDGHISIKGGRHPVVERMMSSGSFIDNDTYLDGDKDRIAIITGPNMAGKSTYMRQVALIVLMAQIGSFIPARSADICICDRIFTRVGASDDLASGQSTFMVEMSEVANILRNATHNSLLILDEIGRGTSTFDGLSIAWAVVEYIADPEILGAKTLFATHYHELTELEGHLDNVKNYCIAVKENGDDIVFLRRIIPGGADKSYGIQVARLAGVPDAVISRAKEISLKLAEAESDNPVLRVPEGSGNIFRTEGASGMDSGFEQLSFLSPVGEEIRDRLNELDIPNMTPLEALNILSELKSKYGK